jgi:type II secretory pathway component GspD/PulD (secretin)
MLAANGQSSRSQKQSQVIAVADARTSSVVVTAAKDLMEQIEGMIRDLDVPSNRDQQVHVFRLENGDPQQAVQVLQSMFQSSTTTRSGISSSSSQNSALMQRQQNNASSGSTSVSGTSTSPLGGGTRQGGGTGGQLF